VEPQVGHVHGKADEAKQKQGQSKDDKDRHLPSISKPMYPSPSP
jgi:hypothetical protein